MLLTIVWSGMGIGEEFGLVCGPRDGWQVSETRLVNCDRGASQCGAAALMMRSVQRATLEYGSAREMVRPTPGPALYRHFLLIKRPSLSLHQGQPGRATAGRMADLLKALQAAEVERPCQMEAWWPP